MSRFTESMTLEQFEQLPAEDFRYAEAEATSPSTDYDYRYRFSAAKDKRLPSMGITTEHREEFLKKGTEQDAQDALVTLAHQTRELTGGVFDIHPFYGAVYGTKINPVAPGFLVDLARPDEGLSVGIDLSDEGYAFDEESTREAVSIGTTVVFPSANARRLMDYMDTPKPNPNQQSRDQAVANKLGDRWDEEFTRFNGKRPRPWKKNVLPAIELTPASAVELMRKLGDKALLTEIVVTWLYTRQDEEKLHSELRTTG